jgi:hypothetical protein
MKKLFPAILLIMAIFVVSACTSNQTAANDMMDDSGAMVDSDTMMDDENHEGDMAEDDSMNAESHGDDMMDTETPGGDAMMTEMPPTEMPMTEMPMVDTPDWFDFTFTDASTGQSFTINDFHGKVVLVETMAIWCSNCLRQQTQVHEFHGLLGDRDDFVSIGLDIDPNENLSALAGYVQKNGFDWLYGVPAAEISNQIGNLYGSQFLNPPSTPILIVDRQGNAHPLPFGIKSASDLLDYVTPFLNENL